MNTPNTSLRAGRAALRATLAAGLVIGLGGCGAFGWMKSKVGGGEAAEAPAAAPAARAAQPLIEAGDAVPRVEPPHPSANNWYGANGRLFRPFTDDREFKERGRAAVYPADAEGKSTASGEAYAGKAMTGAHSRLPIPSYARVTNLRTGKSAIVRINDRGAYDRDEEIQVSMAAALKLDLSKDDEVDVVRITPAEIAALASQRTAAAPAPAPPPPAPPPPAAAVVPQAAPAPAEPTPLQPVAPAPAPEPAPAATPAAPAAVAPAAPVVAAAPPSMTTRAAPATTAPARAAPARAAPPPAPAAAGGWSIQIAKMAVPSVAESVRTRVAQQLAQGAPDLPVPRVEKRGNRSVVLVDGFPDQASAEAAATRMRSVLRQDVLVERR